jgi:hypothetical protein
MRADFSLELPCLRSSSYIPSFLMDELGIVTPPMVDVRGLPVEPFGKHSDD